MLRWTILLTTMFLAGCGTTRSIPEVPVAETQRDAGTVRITPVAVYNWDKIREALKPKFNLDAATALTKVLPTTAATDRRVLDALGASLAIKLPSASEVLTSTTTTGPVLGDDGNPTGDVLTSLTSEEVLTENKQQLPADAAGRLFEGQAAPAASEVLASLGQDPELQYRSAAALIQEVQFLNTYIDNVVVPAGFEPYLVRLQIAVTPSRRDQPLDVFTDLYVFNDDRDANGDVIESSAESKFEFDSFPRVLPILVTDNLESRSDHQLERRLRTFLGAFSGTLKGIGASASIDRVLDTIEELTANDLNSLFTVSQLTSNGIRLRFGARNGSNKFRYELVPRTHTVTMLVMVPKGSKDSKVVTKNRELQVMAKTIMRRTDTGDPLKTGTFNDLPGRLAQVIENAELIKCNDPSGKSCIRNTKVINGITQKSTTLQPFDSNGKSALARKLITRYVARGDRKQFEARLCAYMKAGECNQRVVQQTWAELGELSALRPTTFTYITLPSTTAPKRDMFLFAGAPATAFVETSDSATKVTVPVNKRFDVKTSDLRMIVTQEQKNQTLAVTQTKSLTVVPAKSFTLVPTSVTVTGNVLQATFPSVKKLHAGLGKDATPLKPSNIVLKNKDAGNSTTCELYVADCPGHWSIALQELVTVKTSPASLGMKLTTTVTALRINEKGETSLSVQVSGKKTGSFGVKVKNGQLKATVNNNGWHVMTGSVAGTKALELSNVTPGSSVEITLAALKPDGTPDTKFKPETISLPAFTHTTKLSLN